MSLTDELAKIHAAEEKRRLDKIREQERLDKINAELLADAEEKIYQLVGLGFVFEPHKPGKYVCSDDRVTFIFNATVSKELEHYGDDNEFCRYVHQVTINGTYKIQDRFKSVALMKVHEFDRVMAHLLHSLGYKLEN